MRVLFLRNFAYMKIKSLRIGKITLSFTDTSKSRPMSRIFNVANMCFSAIQENKILTKISEFTVKREEGLGRIVQSVASMIADPGVVSSILAPSHTFVEIDHEIFSMIMKYFLWTIYSFS